MTIDEKVTNTVGFFIGIFGSIFLFSIAIWGGFTTNIKGGWIGRLIFILIGLGLLFIGFSERYSKTDSNREGILVFLSIILTIIACTISLIFIIVPSL